MTTDLIHPPSGGWIRFFFFSLDPLYLTEDFNMYEYKAKVLRTIDGDTYVLSVDVGFSITIEHTFRLNGVDTPETYRPSCEAERTHGKEATDFVRSLIEGKDVIIVTHKLGVYGRYVADVYLMSPEGMREDSLADLLIQNGLEKLKDYPLDNESGAKTE
jgi:micrococcal nuclease